MDQTTNAAKHYDALLFDFDGVLADTEPLHYECWAEVLRPLGIELGWEAFQKYGVGLTDLALMEFLAAQAPTKMEPETIRSKVQDKKKLFVAKAATCSAISDATAFAVKLCGGYKMAIVSSSSRLEVVPMLSRAGILSCFSTFVFGKEAGRPKPAPDPYLLAASRLDAKSPLVIEDSDAGIASGRAAGFAVLRVPHPEQLPGLLLRELGIATDIRQLVTKKTDAPGSGHCRM